MEDLKQIQSHLDETIKKAIDQVADDKASKKDVEALAKAIDTQKAVLAALGEDAQRETKKYSKNGLNWTKTLQKQLYREFNKAAEEVNLWRKSDRPEDMKKHYVSKASNVNEIDSTSGLGFLPTAVDSIINMVVPVTGIARSCRIYSGIHGSVILNTLNAYPTVARTVTSTVNRDDSTVTANSPTYTKITLQPLQSSGIVKVTEKLIYDATPGALENAVEALGISFGLAEDTELFSGDGTATYGLFTGLKTATIGYSNQTVNVRTGSFTNFDPLLACGQFVHPSVKGSPNAKYWMHPATFALLQSFKASTAGLYFYDQSTNVFKVAGAEIGFSQVLDAPDANGTTFAIGKVPVIFGDLERAVVLGLGRDMRMKVLDQLYAATNEIGVQGTYDFAFGIVNSPCITRISVVS